MLRPDPFAYWNGYDAPKVMKMNERSAEDESIEMKKSDLR